MHARSGRTWLILSVMAVVALTLVGCGGDDDDDAGNGGGGNGDTPAATPTEPADNGGGGSRTGTFTLGADTWTVDPNIQCGVFPGPVVYISGNAVEDPAVEIVIDFDEENDLVGARLENADGSWRAEGDAISFDIDGRVVRGEGTFREFISGATADGSFEVTC